MQVQQQYEEALAQDPSVFDYDGVYDQLQQERTLPKQQEKIERKSRCTLGSLYLMLVAALYIYIGG